MDTIDVAVEIIRQIISENKLNKMTMSNPFKKTADYFKISVKPKKGKDKLFYQASLFFETKVKHENFYDSEALLVRLLGFLDNYRQIDILTQADHYQILINKNRTCKMIKNELTEKSDKQIEPHNNEKAYIIPDGAPVDWLFRLGIMNAEGKVLASKQKKFRQINRFLEIIEDVSAHVPDNAQIIDVGCGKSYLTFAMHYYFNTIKNKNASITGLDLKKDVVENCQAYSDEFGFENLHFYAQDIETFKLESGKADMVVSLHACDTATDHALYNAVKWGAKTILCVPCCQHELFNQVNNTTMQPLLKHGVLKERFAALLTDTLRALLLEAYGYKCTVMEFIDMEHTPKNIMIRAIKKQGAKFNEAAFNQYSEISEMYGVTPKLFELLRKASKSNVEEYTCTKKEM